VKVTVNKIDDANISVSGTVENSVIEANIDRLAKEAGKQMKVDGFRPGKVPPHIVKKLHGDKLRQDAESEALKALMTKGSKRLGSMRQILSVSQASRSMTSRMTK